MPMPTGVSSDIYRAAATVCVYIYTYIYIYLYLYIQISTGPQLLRTALLRIFVLAGKNLDDADAHRRLFRFGYCLFLVQLRDHENARVRAHPRVPVS